MPSSSSCFLSLVNTIPNCLNFSTCFSDSQLTYIEHWTGFLERESISVLVILIYISALSHAAAKSFNARWRPDSVEESNTKLPAQKMTDLAVSNNGTLIDLTALVDPFLQNYKKEINRTLAWDQRKHIMALISYHWHEHRFPVFSRNT